MSHDVTEVVIEGFALSPQQKRLWSIQKGDAAYCGQCAVLLEGRVKEKIIRDALQKVVARHEILRTTFHSLPGMEIPVQAISDSPAYEFDDIDLSHLNSAIQEARLDELTREQRNRAFDLARGPAARFSLIRLSEERRILLCQAPSMCADSCSFKNLFTDIAAAYAASSGGRDAAADVVQYADFSAWQSAQLEGDQAQAGMRYWQDFGKGLPHFSGFPFEKNDAEKLKYFPQSIEIELGSERLRKVASIAEQAGVGIDVVMLACWQVLLWRFNENRDLVIGCLSDGRKYEPVESALGLYARFLPIHVRMEKDFRFIEVLKAVDSSLKEACAQEDYFQGDESSPPQDQRFFNLGFEHQDLVESISVGGLRFSLLRQSSVIEKIKLSLVCASGRRGIQANLLYDAALWEAEGVSWMASAFASLLDSALSVPGPPIGELEMMSPSLGSQILINWNDSSRLLTHPGPLHQRFEEQALAAADAIAVSNGEQALTFRGLNEAANRLARFLINRGLGAESVAAVLTPRGLEQLICVWGVWKAGAAFLPIDVNQPPLRMQAMIKEARPALAITDYKERIAGLAETIKGTGVELAALDALEQNNQEENSSNPQVQVAERSLAYLIFTSGSTGAPKAVMIEHGAAANLLEALNEAVYRSGRVERVTLNAPLIFDASIKQVIQLALGRTLILTPDEIRGDGRRMVEFVAREGVEALDCTPSQLRLMVDAGLLEKPSSLTMTLIGGEAIAETLKQDLNPNSVRFYNLYGPTECTVDSTVAEISAISERVSIGRRLNNVQVYVLDDALNAVAPGIAGELWISGRGVGRGYYERPALTAEKFAPNPYAGNGERMYQTGDICRYMEGGKLEYLRRIDRQVKLRGNRVELGEIERALEEHPWVRQAVTIIKEKAGESRLVGYVVGKAEEFKSGELQDGSYQLANGLKVQHQSKEETEALYNEIFVRRAYEKGGVRAPRGETVIIDAGANIGLFTLYMLGRNPLARVIAIEPIGEVCEKLRRNVRSAEGRVTVRQAGLGKKKGTSEFIYYKRMSVLSGMRKYADEREEKTVIKRILQNDVEKGDQESGELLMYAEELLERRLESRSEECVVENLSDVMREEGVSRIGLLKVDVQGAEVEVLDGLDDGDWEKIEQVVAEVHDSVGGENGRVRQVTQLLQGKGYRVEVEQDDRMEGTGRYNIYAVKENFDNGIEDEFEQWTGIENPIEASETELKQSLRRRLPEYMIPSAIVTLRELPMTRNGKVDLERLKNQADREEVEKDNPGAGRTPYEEMLSAIWDGILETKVRSVKDHFFECGGHSLSATRLVSKIREVMAVELPLRMVFEKPVLSEMAEEIEERRKGEADEKEISIEATAGEERAPLSYAQQRLWFLNQLQPEGSEYNSWRAIRAKGDLNIEALRKALNEILRRHQVLRTRYPVVDGMPAQEIVADQEIVLEELDLRTAQEEEREKLAEEIVRREGARGFDLATGPLFVMKAIRIGEADIILVAIMHHIVSDAWSLGIFVKELNALYDRYSKGEQSPLEDLKVQYADYARWQRLWAEGKSYQKQMRYWSQQLAGDLPILKLRVDRRRTARPSNKAAQHGFKINQRLTTQLKALSRKEGATLFMTLLGAYKVLLHHYSGQEDVIVGAPIANRNRSEVESLIGFFVNILALRTDLSGAPGFVEILHRVKEAALNAYANQDIPFEKIVEELRPERSLHRSPLFQVTFTLQNTPVETLFLPGLKLEPLDFESEALPYDFMLDMWELPDGLAGSFRYDTALFTSPGVSRLIRRFELLLQTVAASPEIRLKDLTDLLGEADRIDQFQEAQELKASRKQKLKSAQRQTFEPLETD